MKVACDYCGNPAVLVTGAEFYPHRPDLSHVQIWKCDPCMASVGCHKNSKAKPLGRLATASLKRKKMSAHLHFDKIWKSREMTRSQAYTYLADRLGIPKKDCHIGMFDEEMCKKVIQIMSRDNLIKQESRRNG